MKFKSVFMVCLILITLCSVSAIYADTYVIGNSTFSLPGGYTMNERDNQVVLYNDTYLLTIYEGPIISTAQAKENRIGMGYTFLGERNYSFDGAKINQQNYNYEGMNICIYTVKKNNQTYLISMILFENDEIPDYEDNPVTEIIDSLEVYS